MCGGRGVGFTLLGGALAVVWVFYFFFFYCRLFLRRDPMKARLTPNPLVVKADLEPLNLLPLPPNAWIIGMHQHTQLGAVLRHTHLSSQCMWPEEREGEKSCGDRVPAHLPPFSAWQELALRLRAVIEATAMSPLESPQETPASIGRV